MIMADTHSAPRSGTRCGAPWSALWEMLRRAVDLSGGGSPVHPLSIEVWHLTFSFALPGVELATPVDFQRRAVAYWTQSLAKDDGCGLRQMRSRVAGIGRNPRPLSRSKEGVWGRV